MELIRVTNDGEITGDYWVNLAEYEMQAKQKDPKPQLTLQPAPKSKKTNNAVDISVKLNIGKGRKRNAI